MKKYFTILMAASLSVPVIAQSAQTVDGDLHLLPRDTRSTPKSGVYQDRSLDGTRESALTYYWINYSAAVDLTYNGLTLENISAVPLWPDSTVKVVGDDAGTPFEYYWWVHSFSNVLDPTSTFIQDYVDYEYYPDAPPPVPTKEWFNDTHAYDVDSVGFYIYYDRYVTDVTDTLYVYITTPGSSAHVFSTLGDPPYQAVYMRYNSTQNHPNGTLQEYMITLGNEDSASFAPKYISIPLDLEIPKDATGNDNKIGIAFSYHPGQSYSFGDTLLDFNDPPLNTNPLNTLWLLVNEENFGALPTSMEDGAYNQSGNATSDVRYGISTTGWNGFYINTMAFLSPEYAWEHPYVDWYLAPKGAAFVPTPTFPCQDLTLEFYDFSNFFEAGTATYYWAFGDGGISFDANPVHTFPSPGTYEVCQVVTASSVSYEACKNVTVDFCTGVESFENLSNVSLYPNPANDLLQWNAAFSGNEEITVEVLNSLGQLMYSESFSTVDQFSGQLDVSNWSAGMYLFRINNGQQNSTTSFIVE